MNKIYLHILFLFLFSTLIFPFGKNKVQYHDFKWKYIESKHFRIHFYEGGENLAKFCSYTAENSYQYIKKDFLYEIKSKINIIIYNSHNHFEETNIMGGIPQESVGGFTEFFKNRVVLPFDGDWESFRHVIHHELTHAVQNRMLFNGNFQAISAGMQQMQLPLWFIEGLAEYQSRGGWDSESDETLRDAVYNGYLPQIYFLSNYMAYKGGQNLLYYISQTYGNEKIGEIIRKLSLMRSTEYAFKEALGLEFSELSENWHRWLESKYWPTFINKNTPEKTATRLSNHMKYRNFINNSPALSPDGLKVAFLSNKSDYFDVFLMRTFDGKIINKIVNGQSTGDFEEFHWLRPGISWSPDSKKIVFSAKSTDQDALFIFEAESGKRIDKFKFNLDGIYSPDWSKKGNKICFMGLKNGITNIYIYNLKTKKLKQVTDDKYSENDPKFSPDGNKIIFSSDRGDDLNLEEMNLSKSFFKKNHNLADIYSLDLKMTSLERLTDNKKNETYPFWIDNNSFGYISNESGITNIYKQKSAKTQPVALTNLVTGCTQANYNNGKLAFTSLFKGGYDIYFINDFAKLDTLTLDTKPRWYKEVDFSDSSNLKKNYTVKGQSDDLRKFTFSKNLVKDYYYDNNKNKKSSFKAPQMFQPKDYELEFSPDIIALNAGYATSYGFMGTTYLQFSDKLSNHRYTIYGNLSQDILNSDINIFYSYLAKRINYGGGFSHDLAIDWDDLNNDDEYDEDEDNVFKNRFLGFHLMASYPLSRYSRFDSNLSVKYIEENIYGKSHDSDYKDDEFHFYRSNTIPSLNLGFSFDNTIWGRIGPENGFRMRLNFNYIPDNEKILRGKDKGYQSQTFTFDIRKYIRLSGDYQFAARVAGGISGGKTPQKFLVGGMSNWFNYSVNQDVDLSGINEKYYSSYGFPGRGYRIHEQSGNRYAMVNLEYRYPLINYLALGFPFNMQFGYIKGVLFTDLFSAWDGNNFRGAVKSSNNNKFMLKDINFSGGLGARMNLGYFILRYDLAWKWDFYHDPSKSKHILSLGTNF